LVEGDSFDLPVDGAVGGGYEGYGDYIHVGIAFGCIHFITKGEL